MARLADLPPSVRAAVLKAAPDITDAQPKKRHKYGAVACEVDGIKFPSKREARRWSQLKLLERAGEIYDLQRQVPYVITIKGDKIGTYYADFVYSRPGKGHTIEDAKGRDTPLSKFKRKCVEAKYRCKIILV